MISTTTRGSRWPLRRLGRALVRGVTAVLVERVAGRLATQLQVALEEARKRPK